VNQEIKSGEMAALKKCKNAVKMGYDMICDYDMI
jgi:hypothetical protein